MTEEELTKLVEATFEEDDERDEESAEAKQLAVALLGPEPELLADGEEVYRCDQCGGSPKRIGEWGECLRNGHVLRPSILSKIRPF